MNQVDLSSEVKQAIYTRQSGMCAFTGKKFEEFNETGDAIFVVAHGDNAQDPDNIVMLWRQHDIAPKTKIRRYLFSHANFPNYDQDQKFNDFKSDIEEISSVVDSAPDITAVRNTINELANNIKLLGLPMSQRNELKTLLHNALSVINQRQSDIVEKNKEEWKVNYETIKTKIDSAIDAAHRDSIFKNGREKLFEVQKELRELKLSADHKISLEKLLSEEIKTLTDKIRSWSENFQMECLENYYTLRNMADEAIQKAFSVETYNDARDVLIDVQNKIKDKSQQLRKNQKDELFGYIRGTFEKLTDKFTEYKRVTDEEAAESYNAIKPQIDAAVEFAKNVNDSNVREAREKLIEAQGIVKEARLKRDQKDEIFSAIREAFANVDTVSAEERKNFETEANANYNTMLPKIELIIVDIENSLDFRTSSAELSAIFAELKLVKLKREQQNKLFNKTRYAFDLLSQKRSEYDKRKFSEKRTRLNGALEDMKQKLNQTNTLLQKDQEILAIQQEKLNSTPEDNQAMKDKFAKIIDEINARIIDRNANISKTQKRIDSIESDIKQISEKEAQIEKNRNKRNNNKEQQEVPKESSEVVEPVNNNETNENTPANDN